MKTTTDFFELNTRDNGPSYYCLRDDAPQYMYDLVYHAHGGQVPNDWRYEMIYHAIEAIENGDDPSDYEPPVYNHELINWLGSHGERQGYVDEYLGEMDQDLGIMSILAGGFMVEAREVASLVVDWLNDRGEL